MKDKQKKIDLGSKTAKDGFKNEDFVVSEFNKWEKSSYAKQWLQAMDYKIDEIEYVKAEKIKGSYKADIQVQVQIEIKLKKLLDVQNLQVKLVSNPKGFNQIDKRWLKNYAELWDFPEDVYKLFQYFTGEIEPKIANPRDERRMFIDEFTKDEQESILKFLENNRTLIITDILKGRGQFSAEWMLVILKLKDEDDIKWALEPINKVLNHFSSGIIEINTKRKYKNWKHNHTKKRWGRWQRYSKNAPV